MRSRRNWRLFRYVLAAVGALWLIGLGYIFVVSVAGGRLTRGGTMTGGTLRFRLDNSDDARRVAAELQAESTLREIAAETNRGEIRPILDAGELSVHVVVDDEWVHVCVSFVPWAKSRWTLPELDSTLDVEAGEAGRRNRLIEEAIERVIRGAIRRQRPGSGDGK